MRVAVTGGSGFIGSNLIQILLSQSIPTINIDICKSRESGHLVVWRRCDLLDKEQLKRELGIFQPTHVVHLAARTDLHGASIVDYPANVAGVESLIEAIDSCKSIERVICASSMLVCRLGYVPSSDTDFAPTTAYGESKVMGERLVRAQFMGDAAWTIVRPCSIWGPRFGEPYRSFFDAVLNRRFVKFGPSSTVKTFGYVGNTVYQLMRLLQSPRQDVHGKVFYLGDQPPLNAGEWASLIARAAKVPEPRRIPMTAMRMAAMAGDLLAKAGVAAPMTTFRFRNMTTQNAVDLNPIYRLAPAPPYDLNRGIAETLAWLEHGEIACSPSAEQAPQDLRDIHGHDAARRR